MANRTAVIKFKVKLSRPATPKGATWTFLVLPVVASAKLPTRSMVTVEGSFEDQPFQATLEPDGQGSHWLKIDKVLREAAGVAAGDRVALEIAPVEKRNWGQSALSLGNRCLKSTLTPVFVGAPLPAITPAGCTPENAHG